MKVFVKYCIPVLAVGLFMVAVLHVQSAGKEDQGAAAKPLIEPPRSPFSDSVAGSGLIEADTENIAVGTPVPGIVTDVLVRVGDRAAVDQPLFILEHNELLAELAVQKVAVQSAESEVERLKNLPRPEEVPIREAAVAQARAQLVQSQANWVRVEKLIRSGAVTEEQADSAREQQSVAEATLARANAELALLNAGAWKYEQASAQIALARSQAELARLQTEISRRTIRARVAGEVLQVNVRPGEFVGTPANQPLIVLGETQNLNVRVDIDEHDIPRFDEKASGYALLRGDSKRKFPLTFKRVEPYVIPKKSLTGDNTERIDTRVLQIIYGIDTQGRRLYVGQQVDVFIHAAAQP